MNHFRISFRRDHQSISSPISLLPIHQIDPHSSFMAVLCITALLRKTGIEMGFTTIQISRFYLPHNKIDYPLLEPYTTKKSSTSQLRRWKPQSGPTVLFRMLHAFPTDTPQQFNNPSHPRNNNLSTANKNNYNLYSVPVLLRSHAFNASNVSLFHIDPSKPTPIHSCHGICTFPFNFQLIIVNSYESSRSMTPFFFSSQSLSIDFSFSFHSLRKEPRKRDRCNWTLPLNLKYELFPL